jgi:hypothetical protein
LPTTVTHGKTVTAQLIGVDKALSMFFTKIECLVHYQETFIAKSVNEEKMARFKFHSSLKTVHVDFLVFGQ